MKQTDVIEQLTRQNDGMKARRGEILFALRPTVVMRQDVYPVKDTTELRRHSEASVVTSNHLDWLVAKGFVENVGKCDRVRLWQMTFKGAHALEKAVKAIVHRTGEQEAA